MQKALVSSLLIVAALTGFGASRVLASPVMTENSQALAAGAAITGQNTGEVLVTAGQLTLACSKLHVEGTVTTNTGIRFVIEVPVENIAFSGTRTGGLCTSGAGPMVWKFTSGICIEGTKGTDNLSLTGCGGSLLFYTEIPGFLSSCEYSASSITGTFVTNGDATVNVNKQLLTLKTGFNCSSAIELDLDLDLTTSNETTLSIS